MPRKTFLPFQEALPRSERSVAEAATGAGAGLWAWTPATNTERERAIRACFMEVVFRPISAQKQTVGKPQGAANGVVRFRTGRTGHIDAMMASPNSEHLISVAPCI